MRDHYLDGGDEVARRALNHDLSRLIARTRAAWRAVGRAHQRVFWSSPWQRHAVR